jgi:hypothetical protein
MGILEFLAEANIRDWLQRRKPSVPRTSTPSGGTKLGKPFEQHLLDEIKDLIAQAHDAEEPGRKALLAKANNLQIQLVVSYEAQGQHLLARRAEQSILQFRNTLGAPETRQGSSEVRK